ncbi:DUF397 domain-containing protein [Streptomyces sp. NPDC059008]|uniref:DUF397 domain-containing protein n=1 Tax=Streptomyces sp. NPDC059008 TaxID=3346693 RepID=UPI00368104AC
MKTTPDLTGATWRKSSYSDGGDDNCVEVADAGVAWRKSSFSDGGADNCIEIADDLTTTVPVRDSKNPAGPVLLFPAGAWSAFIRAVKAGRLGPTSN